MSTSGTFFIRLQGQIVQWCSGTVVASASKSLVWTAAHCFYDPKTRTWFDTDVVFVPGYNKGNRPFGAWRARLLAVHPRWLNMSGESERWSHDVAAVVLEPREGQFVQDVVGAQGIWFNLGRGQRYVSNGYPVDPPFNGDSLFTCRARFGGVDRTAGTPASTGIGCDMTGGSSGGSWLIGLGQGPARGLGWVFSVNSYGYGNTPEMYGPYHGKDALAFYRRMSQ
jgi:V8-like Glu-specific endopeptidase